MISIVLINVEDIIVGTTHISESPCTQASTRGGVAEEIGRTTKASALALAKHSSFMM